MGIFSKPSSKTTFADMCVIYRSFEDNCWVAHSLRTDQIGTGSHPFEALTDLLRGLDGLLELAKEQKDIQVFRDAPPEIQDLAESAPLLPNEIYRIAYGKLHHSWPEGVNFSMEVTPENPIKVEINEQVGV